MGLTSLHDFFFFICRSLLGHSTFLVGSLFFMKGTSCCVISRNFKRNITCMSLRGVWHLRVCHLPCVYAWFWLVPIASYVFKSPSICFQGTKYEINFTLWRRALYGSLGLPCGEHDLSPVDEQVTDYSNLWRVKVSKETVVLRRWG